MTTLPGAPPAIRLGCVQYLNTLALIQGLAAWKDATLVPAVPARLIDLLLSGQIDLGLLSTIDYARSPEPLVLIPAGMIGCDGPTLTVRLFSSVPIDRITTLHADTDSHTSVTLARIILARRYHRGVVPVVDFDAHNRASAWPETLLLIGDKVVTETPPSSHYPHELDLGEAWKDLTGLPFVYAMWMARQAAWDDAEAGPRLRTAAAMLARARLRNRVRADWLVSASAGPRGWSEDLARRYVGEYLRYEVGPREREAVARFLDEAAALDLAPRHELRWAEF